MKAKYYNLLIVFCFLALIFSLIVNEKCIAQGNRAEVSFVGSPTYRLTNKVDKNGIQGWTYEINVTLQNTGDKKSDELLINLSSEEDSLHKTIILEPGNTTTVSFIWSTISDKDQEFNIRFYPTNIELPRTSYNSGSTSFTLVIEDVDKVPSKSTPGFGIILVFISLIISMIYLKKRRK